MINKIKVLLGISDDISDEKLTIYLDFVCEYVKSYCGFNEIPEKLESVICMLVCAVYRNYENASSLSLGDVSIDFKTSDMFLEYRNILNKYRKVGSRWSM
ncbi:MAG: phage head-tail connector protein [Clostridia bacterium]